MGIIVNNRSQHRILFEVYPQAEPVFQVETRNVIDAIHALQYQLGTYFKEKYDEKQPNHIAV